MVPPQQHIPPAANILGTLGTVLWCVQLGPQIWQNWRRRSTDGVPAAMMVLWAACGPPFGAYAVVQRFNVPVQVQPQVFTLLAVVAWAQTLVYGRGWAGWGMAGRRGFTWPLVFVGVLAILLDVAGLVPLYVDMWRRRGRVVGINFIFLTIDSLGALFSLASVACQDTFDPLGASSYIAILVAEAVVFLSHLVWLARGRNVRGGATSAGLDSGDSVAASAEGVAVEDVKVMPKGSRIRVTVEEDHTSTGDSEGGAVEVGHVCTKSPV